MVLQCVSELTIFNMHATTVPTICSPRLWRYVCNVANKKYFQRSEWVRQERVFKTFVYLATLGHPHPSPRGKTIEGANDGGGFDVFSSLILVPDYSFPASLARYVCNMQNRTYCHIAKCFRQERVFKTSFKIWPVLVRAPYGPRPLRPKPCGCNPHR